jgi:hypothetical protein
MTYRVSNIAAVLKSLSPAGKKIGPMFSLSVQGLLFNLGVFLFGVNVFGLCFGMILLSTWTFIQPLVTYYLFFGDKIFTAVEYLYTKTLPYHHVQKKHLWLFFIFLVCLKMVIACFLAIVALRRKNKSLYLNSFENVFTQKAKEYLDQKKTSVGNPIMLSLKDLFQPLFLISLFITTFFLYFSNSNNLEIVIYLIRPIAIGFIFFYFSRTLTLDRWLSKAEHGRFRTFSLSCQSALKKLRKFGRA